MLKQKCLDPNEVGLGDFQSSAVSSASRCVGHATEQAHVMELCAVGRGHAMVLQDGTTEHVACVGHTSPLQEMETGNWLKVRGFCFC